MPDVPSRHRHDSTSFNGIPSAMDELQVRQLIRDLGNIEKKGLQQRGTQTETARVYAHLSEIMLHDALAESKMRDIAHEELTEDEYLRFDQELKVLHQINHQAHVETLRMGYGQMHDNIRRQPIPSAGENAADSLLDGIKDVFMWFRFGRKD